MQSTTGDLKKQKPTKVHIEKIQSGPPPSIKATCGWVALCATKARWFDDGRMTWSWNVCRSWKCVLCLSLSSGHTCFSARCGNNYAIHYHRCLPGRRCKVFALQSILRIFSKPSLLWFARTALMMTHSGTPWKKCASKRDFACNSRVIVVATESDRKAFKAFSMAFPWICLEAW